MRTPAAAPATAPGDTELLLEPVPVESDQQYYYLCFEDRMTQWVGAIVTHHPLHPQPSTLRQHIFFICDQYSFQCSNYGRNLPTSLTLHSEYLNKPLKLATSTLHHQKEIVSLTLHSELFNIHSCPSGGGGLTGVLSFMGRLHWGEFQCANISHSGVISHHLLSVTINTATIRADPLHNWISYQ